MTEQNQEDRIAAEIMAINVEIKALEERRYPLEVRLRRLATRREFKEQCDMAIADATRSINRDIVAGKYRGQR